MRLLIGWCIRSVLVCAVVSLGLAWLIFLGGTKDGVHRLDYLTTYWWTWLLTSLAAVTYWISDYLIDHDEWRALNEESK